MRDPQDAGGRTTSHHLARRCTCRIVPTMHGARREPAGMSPAYPLDLPAPTRYSSPTRDAMSDRLPVEPAVMAHTRCLRQIVRRGDGVHAALTRFRTRPISCVACRHVAAMAACPVESQRNPAGCSRRGRGPTCTAPRGTVLPKCRPGATIHAGAPRIAPWATVSPVEEPRRFAGRHAAQ